MRLYICIDGSFAGTQADAKAKGRGFTEVDVPTDKAGLIAYLNDMVDEARTGGSCDAIMDEPLTTAYSGPLAPVVTPETQRQWDAESITGFILDRATVAQVEQCFAALGARFAEARKH